MRFPLIRYVSEQVVTDGLWGGVNGKVEWAGNRIERKSPCRRKCDVCSSIHTDKLLELREDSM